MLRKELLKWFVLAISLLLMGSVALSGQAEIIVTSPNGGEVWQGGASRAITWISNGITGNVRIEYSLNNGGSWRPIRTSAPNTGSYIWTLPQLTSKYCLVRISSGQTTGCSNCETRGTWIIASAINSAVKRADILRKCEQANLNTLLVSAPMILGNWGYGSSTDFLSFIREAKERGFSVHAWIPNSRRLWAIRQTDVDYCSPAEQEAQAQWAVSLLNAYGIYLDGVHLDYIRYMKFDIVNNDGKMDGVRTTVRRISEEIRSKHPGKLLSAAVFTLKPNRFDSKSDGTIWRSLVPEWFRKWSETHPGTPFTSSSFYYMGPHHMQVQQDPVGWLKEGIIDALMPMQYTINDETWQRETYYWKEFNQFAGNDFTRVYSGLSWKTGKYDAAANVRNIKYDRSLGLKGNFIFRFTNADMPDEPMIDALTKDSAINKYDAPYKTKVPSCIDCRGGSTGPSDTSNQIFTIQGIEDPPITNGGIRDFAVFALNSMYMRTGVKIHAGAVGVKNNGNEPKLGENSELVLSTNVYMDPQSPIFANRVIIKPESSVADVNCNTIKNYGVIRGRTTTGAAFPLSVSLPSCPTSTPATGTLTVYSGQIVSLNAGSHGSIIVKKGGTLMLKGGVYHVRNIRLEGNSKLLCQGNVQVILMFRLETGDKAIIAPADTSAVSASGILFFVNGQNGNGGSLNELPEAVVIGLNNTIFANICAPYGSILVKSRSKLEGALAARDIMLDFYVEITRKNGF